MATFSEENDEFLVELIAKNPPIYDSRLKTYKDNVVRDNIWEHIASKLNKTSDYCRKRWKCIRDSYQRIKRKNKLPTGSAAGSKSKKWPLMERLTFLENVPAERKTIGNIERTNDTYDSENEASNYDETCFNKEKDINVEPNEIEMNSEGTCGSVMVNAPSSAIEVDVEETAYDEEQNKKTRSRGSVLKKKKHSQNSSMQAALLNYWKERDTERRAQIQALTTQSTSDQDKEDVDGITSFCSHVGTMLKKLTPALRVEAKTKVFNILADYELRSLNESSTGTSLSSAQFDQNSQFSSTNPYSPISSVASPGAFCEATDLSISNTFNLPTNTSENMCNTYFQLDNYSYLPESEK